MEHNDVQGPITRPPLRVFRVTLIDPDNPGWREYVSVAAHLVFNNKNRGEGLVFRRYYNDSVKTEVVAEFEQGHFAAYFEVDNG